MKKSKKLKLLFGILLGGLAVAVFFTSPLISATLLLGAVIEQGILGGLRGKIGSVVGFNWKGINALRIKVTPANPKSAGQVEQRGQMSQAIAVGKQILSTVIQPYWNPYAVKKSGFNAFVGSIVKLLTASTHAVNTACKMAIGSLEGVSTLSFTYTTGTGAADFTWADNSGVGNALATDGFLLVVMGIDGTLYGTQESTVNVLDRSDGADSLTIATGLTAAEVIGFMFFHRGTGSSLIVSNSDADLGS